MPLLNNQIPEYLGIFSEVEDYQPQKDLIDKYMHIQLFNLLLLQCITY